MKTTDLKALKISSTAQPTAEDIEIWESLSDDQRRVLIERDEQAAFESGIADGATLREVLAKARAKPKRDL